MRDMTIVDWLAFGASCMAGVAAWLANPTPNPTERFLGAALAYLAALWLCGWLPWRRGRKD